MSQPFGFLRFPLKISLYSSMLLLLMASSNVIVIIIGTSFAGKPPGMVVPSSEQKQSGNTHTVGSVEYNCVQMCSEKWNAKFIPNHDHDSHQVYEAFFILNFKYWISRILPQLGARLGSDSESVGIKEGKFHIILFIKWFSLNYCTRTMGWISNVVKANTCVNKWTLLVLFLP